jgi:hypothetical protein
MATTYTFESGIPAGWTTVSGTTAWVTAAGEGPESGAAIKSGAIVDNQASGIQFTAPTVAAGERLRFTYKVSSEAPWEQFRVFVNGVLVWVNSGESGWQTTVLDVASSQVVQFVYQKDYGSSGDDCARLFSVAIEEVTFSPGTGTTAFLINDNMVSPGGTTTPAYLWEQSKIRCRFKTYGNLTGLDYYFIDGYYDGNLFIKDGDNYISTNTSFIRSNGNYLYNDAAKRDVNVILSNCVFSSASGSEIRYLINKTGTFGIELWLDHEEEKDVYSFLCSRRNPFSFGFYTSNTTNNYICGFTDKVTNYSTLTYTDILAGFQSDGGSLYYILNGARTLLGTPLFNYYVFFAPFDIDEFGTPIGKPYSENIVANKGFLRTSNYNDTPTLKQEYDFTAKNIKYVAKQTNLGGQGTLIDRLGLFAVSESDIVIIQDRWRNYVRSAERNS